MYAGLIILTLLTSCLLACAVCEEFDNADGNCEQEDLCQNGGSCIPVADLELKPFLCVCQPGFRGVYCQEVNPECHLNSCNETQVCVTSVNGSFCLQRSSVVLKQHQRHIGKLITWKSAIWIVVPIVSFFLARPLIRLILCLQHLRMFLRQLCSKKDINYHFLSDGETGSDVRILRAKVEQKLKVEIAAAAAADLE